METSKIEKIQPEKAVEILKKDGLNVSVEQAKKILELLNKLANIAVSQYLRQ